jgi:5-methylthioribose kinase
MSMSTYESMSLKYKRGSFQVLDQLLLPGKKVFVEVKDSKDSWSVIRNMQVRGAPLIGIVAVLGVAVEAHNASYSSTAEARKELLAAMQYLQTSRPTAVNLFTATDDLAAAVEAAYSSPDASTSSVVQACIECAETLLAEDVKINRAMGAHGAKRILELTGKEKIKVLTICNTGSLATAGHGTALGVVRCLHEQGKLEHVYACETRPYNQGARLTAFEIVEDGLPGTLITDSMASALMRVKGVDCVVVGADRVAANGDTANKIGTYQLAIAAQYHKVPFFAAVPTTTLDLTMENGDSIPVEQRPPQELTTIFGQRLCPEGISVWNPAFDVTPCGLIKGIITEVGVAEADTTISDNTDRVIDIPSFLRTNGKENLCGKAVNVRTNAPSGFQVLNEELLTAYLSSKPLIRTELGFDAHGKDLLSLEIQEVGDGNLNFVYIVAAKDTSIKGKKLVVKQALPYIRVVESWPLTLERASFEARALNEQYRLCPDLVPVVHNFDPVLAIIIMRFVEEPHIILRKSFIQGLKFSSWADHLSTFLANTLYGTSALALNGTMFRNKVSEWSRNVQLCALTERVVFTDPYSINEANRWTSPQLDDLAKWFREDSVIKTAAAIMKGKFIGCTEALVHGDLHSGSVMAMEGSTYVIDPEFAFYGPMGFDTGALLANILLAYYSQAARVNRADYGDWLLDQLVALWEGFVIKFTALWDKNQQNHDGERCRSQVFNSPTDNKAAQEAYFKQLWMDTLGFAGMKIVRRILGIAHVEDMESIEDLDTRAACERRALTLGRQLIMYGSGLANDSAITSVQSLVILAKKMNDSK